MGLGKLTPVDYTDVTLRDAFWAPRMETNRTVTLPIQYRHLVDTGRIAGIDPDHKPGDRTAHHQFWDSDVAKWMETAAYSLSGRPDPEVEARLDEVIAAFAKLQRPDGYINSWYTSIEPDKRWSNLRDMHELYCAGHLIEAAVAHFRATGKRHFLDMMCRYADYIDSVFGREKEKRKGYPGHQEVELALVKLYHATGNDRYLKLAAYFIDERGKEPHYYDIEARERGQDPSAFYHQTYEYCQAHLPVREQSRITGHAVRAMYLYCGMVDVARETGDETLVQACERLWDDVCRHHMYVTGGIGQSKTNEGFTFHYDLPEETAYCETCAAIGLAFWNHRMLQLSGDGRYADCLERALYNGTVSGVSLSGDRFFYVNPLASLGRHHREPWFGCACCPGNISRMIASVGQYFYSVSDDTAWVHFYGEGEGRMRVGGREFRLIQRTRYPWDGRVEIRIEPLEDEAHEFVLALRIPGWCKSADVTVNGRGVGGEQERGYLKIKRAWRRGDTVSIALAMPVERVRAHPNVRMANGNVALQRGPIVYCLEEEDNPVRPLTRIALPRTSELEAEFRPDLLGGVTVVTGAALAIEDEGSGDLYTMEPPTFRPMSIMAVPYCVWDNRGPGEMRVWLRECSQLPPPAGNSFR